LSSPTVATTWYQNGLRFECQRCGGCCRGEPGYVWVRHGEIAAIARILGLSTSEFMRRYARKVWNDYSLVERENGDCVFWSPEGCEVYEVRPTQCRTFPFWHEYVRSPEAWEQAAQRCPGVGKGRLYSGAEIARRVELTDS
jgi:Fe-S-cluster containining protein